MLRNFGAKETRIISVKLFGVDAMMLKWFSENNLSNVSKRDKLAGAALTGCSSTTNRSYNVV